jgi:hypothetical protein
VPSTLAGCLPRALLEIIAAAQGSLFLRLQHSPTLECREHEMLWDALGLKGYAILGENGPLGTVSDLLFDDGIWMLRWLIGSTGAWMPHHEVLLPARSIKSIDPGRRRISLALTMDQIEASPGIELDAPVSRQTEIAPRRRASCDPHLRSVEAVVGHRVHTPEGVVGHVDDLLVNDADWSIQFFRVDTWSWHPGHYILIPPRLLGQIDWPGRSIHLDVERRQIENGPPLAIAPLAEGGQLPSCGIRLIRH